MEGFIQTLTNNTNITLMAVRLSEKDSQASSNKLEENITWRDRPTLNSTPPINTFKNSQHDSYREIFAKCMRTK